MSFLKLFLSIIFIVNISTQFLNADARYMTEWTNPDGSKSKSPATFYSIKEAKTQSTPKLLSWECGMTDYVEWANWEIDFEKNVLRSWWKGKFEEDDDYRPYAVYKILSAKDGSITVQDYLRDGKMVDKDEVVIWEFNYQSDNLYTIWKGNKHNFYCKNTTNYNVPQTASILTWECGPSEYIKWINWELDLEKNELKSRWVNKNSIKERSSIAQIKSNKDGIATVQDDILDGNKATTNDIWDFYYDKKDQLYTVWKGKKWFYGDCKSTTPIKTASLANKVNSQIGHYANDKRNRFIGSYKDGGASFEGYWVQEKSGQECSSIVDGSRFYGKVWFKMVSEEKFEGRWGFCDTAPIFAWNGHQVSFTSDVTKTLSSKQQRVKIQKSLNFFGFNAGSPDGVFGKKTKTAIGELQTCWAGIDPSASTFPKTTEFGVLTPRQMQVLMETYDSARKSYSKANCFYFQTLI